MYLEMRYQFFFKTDDKILQIVALTKHPWSLE